MSLITGQLLSHYRVLGPLGPGAMGEVYRAKDTRLEREVAIKVLPEHFAEDAERLRRFEREARSLASCNHPNVAQIFGVDQVDGVWFLVLELVPGVTLEERIARGPLPLREAVEACRQIAESLGARRQGGLDQRQRAGHRGGAPAGPGDGQHARAAVGLRPVPLPRIAEPDHAAGGARRPQPGVRLLPRDPGAVRGRARRRAAPRARAAQGASPSTASPPSTPTAAACCSPPTARATWTCSATSSPAAGFAQLTDHPGSDWDGAFTPDGRSLLWGSDRSGSLEIWISKLDGTGARQITQDSMAAENPTMTPDGTWIVHSSGRAEAPGIYKVRSDGSQTTLLVAGNWIQPEVSPDGRHAIFVGSNNALLRNRIGVVDLDSGEVTAFQGDVEFDLRSGNVTYGRGRWMPDGSAIVYLGLDERGHTGLWVQDFDPARDTRHTRRALTGFDGAHMYESFGISPDGKRLVFSAVERSSATNLAEHLPSLGLTRGR